MYIGSVPLLLKKLLPSALEWSVNTSKRELFLTFDDGPIPEVTPWVLDQLDQFDAKATFFCVGDNVRKYPEVYQEVLRRGHAVGNHSYHHVKGWKGTVSDYQENVRMCRQLVDSRLFRPPHGQITFRLAHALALEYRLIMWTVLTRDYSPKLTHQQVLNIALKGSKPGAIVVFHDSFKAWPHLQQVLPRYLSAMKQQGYTFSKL